MVPWVLDTKVLPTFRTLNTDGALMSYQSFLAKGSTLQGKTCSHHETDQRRLSRGCRETDDFASAERTGERREEGAGTHIFFLPPFLPLEMRLFFPTAMAAREEGGAAAAAGGRRLQAREREC